MSELVLERIREYLARLLPTMDLELFDLQFRREGHGWVLRVFIDTESGVSLDHCATVSRELGQYLDVEDLISHAYHLEVSSPGLERPLRSLEEFRRACGKKVRLKVHQAIGDQKIFEGTLRAVAGDSIQLELVDGGLVELSYPLISKARLAL
jgi:ribosome maturation factor RimP